MRAAGFLAVPAALFAATPAAATDWVANTATDNSRAMAFIDKDSIRDTGDRLRQAHVYVVLAQTTGEGIAALDALLEFDCAQPRRRFLSSVGFDDAMTARRPEPGSGEWREIRTGTPDHAVRDLVCSGGVSGPTPRSFGSAYPFAAARAMLRAQ